LAAVAYLLRHQRLGICRPLGLYSVDAQVHSGLLTQHQRLVCCEKYVQNRPPCCRKVENAVQFYLLKHWKELERGNFGPNTLTRGSAPGPCWGLH